MDSVPGVGTMTMLLRKAIRHAVPRVLQSFAIEASRIPMSVKQRNRGSP
jgi:hypothetical protein